MTIKENRAAGGDQSAAGCSVDDDRRGNPTKSCQLSPTRRLLDVVTAVPETALAAAYAEALARREGSHEPT
jgi:hypothetical protein